MSIGNAWINKDTMEIVEAVVKSITTKAELSNQQLAPEDLYQIAGTAHNIVSTILLQNLFEQVDKITSLLAEYDSEAPDKDSIKALSEIVTEFSIFKNGQNPSIKHFIDVDELSAAFSIKKQLVTI